NTIDEECPALARTPIGASPMSLTTVPDTITPVLETADLPAGIGKASPSFLSHIYRLTVKQYDQMVEAGILGKRDRVELIEGILVAKMGRNRPHIVSGKKALRILERTTPQGWHVAK